MAARSVACRWGSWVGAAIGFISFGLCASATYILNDLLDLDADRRHRAKRNRPFAAGDLSVMAGMIAVKIFFWHPVARSLSSDLRHRFHGQRKSCNKTSFYCSKGVTFSHFY